MHLHGPGPHKPDLPSPNRRSPLFGRFLCGCGGEEQSSSTAHPQSHLHPPPNRSSAVPFRMRSSASSWWTSAVLSETWRSPRGRPPRWLRHDVCNPSTSDTLDLGFVQTIRQKHLTCRHAISLLEFASFASVVQEWNRHEWSFLVLELELCVVDSLGRPLAPPWPPGAREYRTSVRMCCLGRRPRCIHCYGRPRLPRHGH
jgi:hypothetical protein